VRAFDTETGAALFTATAESLGSADARLRITEPADAPAPPLRGTDHAAALEAMLEALRALPGLWAGLGAVGHRVVHGAERFTGSQLLDDEVLAAVEDCSRLAPLHNPANLLGIRVARAALPHLPHVAVFDTAFHQTMPEQAYRYAVPEEWYRRYGVRRYGFHGTSHRFVTARAAELLERPLADLELISAHLGNGCSATAVSGGRSVDTTMGMTPLEGLVMGTRSGDLDPAIVLHLQEREGLTAAELSRSLNGASGLLGLSGLSNDMRALLAAEDSNPRARLAIDVFCHRLAKHLAALSTSLTRLDALIFTGGIGEHAAPVRARVAARLTGLGVRLDPVRNAAGETFIQADDSPVAILVVPTNEELLIARDAAAHAAAQG
jgi:acetate kinase